MGIPVLKIFESDVFNVSIDFDSWPGSHENDQYIIKPYNGSFFDLRDSYSSIFSELVREKETDDSKLEPSLSQYEDQGKNITKKKKRVYKIKYSINLLPSIGEYVLMKKNVDG